MTTAQATLTPGMGVGPLYTFSLMFEGAGEAVAPDAEGALTLHGNVFDGTGEKLCAPDAMLELLQGDQFARTATDDRGDYRAVVRKPDAIALPDGRRQAPHFDVMLWVFPCIEAFQTRIYFPEDEALHGEDPLLCALDDAARAALIARRDGGDSLAFDIHVSGEHQTPFFVPAGLPSAADSDEITVVTLTP